MPTLVAAGLGAVAAALAVRPTRTPARLATWLPTSVPGEGHLAGRRDPGEDLLTRRRGAVSLLAGAAPLLLVGGLAGVVVCGVTVVLVHRLLGAREPAAERRRREAVARGLPEVVDLLAVALASGASPGRALSIVAEAVEGPIVADLLAVEGSLALGRDPSTVWREVARRPELATLGRAMARAVETGASVSEALHRLAEDLHASARLEAESRARSVGVRTAAPLGLCLLPAFVLVGVVPLVAGTVGSLLAG